MKQLNKTVYRHETAYVYGKVSIGEGSSLWTYSVIRSEFNAVNIGRYTNIQDFVMIHVGDKTNTVIGDYCSIAHKAIIHGATIGDNCLIGVAAVVMDGCVIGNNTIIGAGSYLPPGTIVPDDTVYQGNPAVCLKKRNNFVANRMNAAYYNINAEHYRKEDYRAWSDPVVTKRLKSIFSAVRKEFIASSKKE